jgi:hypothetical protein
LLLLLAQTARYLLREQLLLLNSMHASTACQATFLTSSSGGSSIRAYPADCTQPQRWRDCTRLAGGLWEHKVRRLLLLLLLRMILTPLLLLLLSCCCQCRAKEVAL